MCDTFVVPPAATANGHWIFAKNSDREPNEAQQWVYMPAGKRESKQIKTSFIAVDHPYEHFGCWLSKPFHLWGAEMGVNDHGLAIGNEAVFTRVRIRKRNDGLTGMDMIRLALESCRNAKEAVGKICCLVEAYGQDACGGYLNRKFYYHNSFLLCDSGEAYVLETAGKHWVYRKLNGFYAISNRLTIGKEWDGISEGAISFARSRNWCRKQEDFDFAAAFTAPVMSVLSKAAQRRASCTSLATAASAGGKFTPRDAMKILRSHAGGEGFRPHRGAMDSICLHASGLLTPSQTTGSTVAELSPTDPSPIWATGSSAPCLSIFKPFFCGIPSNHERLLVPPGSRPDESHWWQWEKWHRKALRNYEEAKKIWASLAQPGEESMLAIADAAAKQNPSPSALGRISDDAMHQSLGILQQMQETLAGLKENPGGLLYRYTWQQWNRKAGFENPGT